MDTNAPMVILKVLQGNDPISLGLLQEILAPHANTLAHLWFGVWIGVGVFVLLHLLREYNSSKR